MTTTRARRIVSRPSRFISPTDGAMTGDSVTAEVTLDGFEIDAVGVGKANEPNKGHLHFSLDGGKFDDPKYSGANGDLAVKLGVDGMYSPSVEPTHHLRGPAEGRAHARGGPGQQRPLGDGSHGLDHVHRRLAMRPAGLALVLAAALGALASGCGGDDDSSLSDSVAVRDFEFSPVDFEAKAGEPVTWENEGEQIHNVKGDGLLLARDEPRRHVRVHVQEERHVRVHVHAASTQMNGTVVVR